MPRDILAESVAWLHQFRAENLVEPVTYTRGALSFEVNATAARAESSFDDGLGILIDHRNQDFLFEMADLLNNGIEEPERGDVIRRIVGHQAIDYEVASDNNEPVWRPMSRYWTDLRIHTVRLLRTQEMLWASPSQIDATVGDLSLSEE